MNQLVRNLDLGTSENTIIYAYNAETGGSVDSYILSNVLMKYINNGVLENIKSHIIEAAWYDFFELYRNRRTDVQRARTIAEYCYTNNIPLTIKMGVSIFDTEAEKDGTVSVDIGGNVFVL